MGMCGAFYGKKRGGAANPATSRKHILNGRRTSVLDFDLPLESASMPIPDFQSMMRPLLQFASDGAEKQFRDAVDYISQQNQVTPEERAQRLSGFFHPAQPRGLGADASDAGRASGIATSWSVPDHRSGTNRSDEHREN
jgi:hypothetical protein